MGRSPNGGAFAGPHPRTIGWVGTTALAMGGSNQSLFLLGALVSGQGSAAVPLLVLGLLLSWAAAPGWTELVLMWPNRVGGIAATCAEAFRPYSPVLANLTGVCYWWGWVPTCGLTAILSATAIHEWYLPVVPIPALASALVLLFTVLNLCGIRWVTMLAIPVATASAGLAFLSGLIPIVSGQVNWQQATTFHLTSPFSGFFGGVTGAMTGLYLVGFAAPAFEAAACHVGETVDPVHNVPRAMFASASLATLYFVALPMVWLGMLGPGPLTGNLQETLGPTFAPLLGTAARSAAIWLMMLNMFHGTLQPLAGAARTLMQLAEDGLLPQVLARRSRTDAPWVATWLTASMAIAFLLTGDPTWVIAAANLTYLIGICLPSVAVWLLRYHEPDLARPYRAPRGTIGLGLIAAGVWGLSTVLGFEQFGLPTVLAGLALAYSGSALYALRRWQDRRRSGKVRLIRSLHFKLTGAMLLVLTLDGAGYLLAVDNMRGSAIEFVTILEDIFVVVALLTVSVGLVLPGMIAHAASEVAGAAERLASGTVADLARAMDALARGDLDAAYARVDPVTIAVRTRDEVGAMAMSFAMMQGEIVRIASALDGAREGLRSARDTLLSRNEALKREAAERAAAEANLRAIIAASPVPIITFDRVGLVQIWNTAAERVFGWSEAEVIGGPSPIVPAVKHQEYDALRAQVLRGDDVRGVEIRRQRKDESWVDLLIAAAPLRDLLGQVIGTMAVFADLTARKQVEQAIEHARTVAEELAQVHQQQAEEAEAMGAVSAALSSTLDLAALYQIILEQASRVLPCDHAALSLYADGVATCIASWGEPRITPGWTSPLTDLWLPEADTPVSYLHDTYLERRWISVPPLVGPYGARSILSAPLRLGDTLAGSFEVSSRTPSFYAERHRRLAAVFADRATQALRNAGLYEAEQRRRRAAEDLAHLRSDFVAAVSHELRTPLTAIVGFGELLQARWHLLSDTHRLQRIAHIVAAANRQKRLVEDLLLLSRLEVDRLVVTCETVLLIQLIDRAVAEVQGSYRAQCIMLDGPTDVQVHADPARVGQVLTNVLDNAAKYSPEGSPVTLSWSVEGPLVAVRTVDQGCGVPEQGREQLFTRFGRVPGSKMRSGRVGTGLGLYLSRQLAEAMGGTLDLEATGPEGSTFRLRLPLAPSP